MPIPAIANANDLEFFESKVRPIFAEHCYSCHSAKAEKIKGDLRLDSEDAILKGGGSGPALTPGQPDASLLIKAVRYTDPDLKMPPKGKKLSAEQIATLESWVKMGAPMPKSSAAPATPNYAAVRSKHWAFQRLKKPEIPDVRNRRWVHNELDYFVLAKLEQKGLQPAVEADRRTLIRRVTYDLIGLPPTYEEVEAFAHDESPDAYARLVERLLASPHYGERWGRYWLDVARFADTKGYLAGGEERRYPFAYTYRDYVVNSFNEDKPYDRFVMEQIAGDKLATGKDKSPLAALGFLTLGRRFLNNQNDIIDDRIDVVTRGTMGLTVTCARCHDHKFDPISTKDYYALHGVFASSHEPAELPLLGGKVDEAQYKDFLRKKAEIEKEIENFKKTKVDELLAELREHASDYLLASAEARHVTDDAKFDTFAREHKLKPHALRRWVDYLKKQRTATNGVFALWFEAERRFAGTNTSGISAGRGSPDPRQLASARHRAEILKVSARSEIAAAGASRAPIQNHGITVSNPPNAFINKTCTGSRTNSLRALSAEYGKAFKEVATEWQGLIETAKKHGTNAPARLPDPDREAVRAVLYAEDAPPNLPRNEAESVISRTLNEGIAPIRGKIDALNWTHPGAPARAMALEDIATPVNSHVLKRGNPSNPGEEVPRRFLTLLAEKAPPFTNGSGRLELARMIANRDNPLFARVFVNRVWLHHFGHGLVSTPGDFGVRTEEPVHRALLDFLAARFIESGWSIKALHRLILLSATYQQSSDADEAAIRLDPDNRLLSRMNRQRLDFEAMRDTALDVSGKLDLTMGGQPVDILAEPFSRRRTIYGFIDRQNLPGLFRTFDFANPDVSNQGRFHTTVPQQALFLMNNPFMLEQAANVAERAGKKCKTNRAKIERVFELVLQRQPSMSELDRAARFVESQPKDAKTPALAKFAQVLILSNECQFVD